MAHGEGGLILGIDLGTTSVKISFVDEKSGDAVFSCSQPSDSSVPSDVGVLGHEQEPSKIFRALQLCLGEDGAKALVSRISAVGVCGQMHGIVLWKSEAVLTRNSSGLHDKIDLNDVASHLYTWEDGRCPPEFISTLPNPASHLRQSTGYGCSTLFWLARKRPGFLDDYDCAGTIQDLLVMVLCRLERPVMSDQNAASWGYFNTVKRSWNTDLLSEAGFPTRFLPAVVSAGRVAGQVSLSDWCSVPARVPVYVAMGDLHCSILAKIEESSDAIMNISTSAQLTICMPVGFTPSQEEDYSKSAIEYVPYFDGLYLAEAPSLNGGNVFRSFVQTVQLWTSELGLEMTEQEIWSKIDALESKLESDEFSDEQPTSSLTFQPTICGERHDVTATGCAQGITPGCASLLNIYRALSVGVVSNLCAMMPVEFLRTHGIKRIVGNGTALTRNSTMRKTVDKLFGLPLVLGREGDAALGAALAARKVAV